MELTKEIIIEFLSGNEHKQMVVATNGSHPWIATVYFGFDDKLSFYFISGPDTLHSKHILENSKIAASIADSKQAPESKKIGLQLHGIAELIEDEAELKTAIRLWKVNVGVVDEKLDHKAVVGRMYKVKPKKIKFFNQELFKVKDGKEPTLELNQ